MSKIMSLVKKPLSIIILMLIILTTFSLLFLFQNLGLRPDIIFPMRLSSLITILVVSVAVGYSTIMFQTATNSKILTPGVVGIESIYLFVQTAFVFALGTGTYLISTIPNFIISVVLMLLLSMAIFIPILLGKKSRGIFHVLLIGIIIGQLFSALTTYMQIFINPDEFAFVQAKMFASFEFPNMFLVTASAIIILVCLLLMPNPKTLDTLSLGKDIAISLGVNYKMVMIRILVLVTILVAVSTVSVGPMMFLGVLVANLTYALLKTHKHIFLIPACILITACALMLSQYFIVHVYNIGVSLSVVINLVGGIFFIILILRKRASDKLC